MTPTSDLQRRHHTERPLAKLTDEELNFLTEIGKVQNLLRPNLAERVSDLDFLAGCEDAEREYQRDRAAS